MKRTLRNIRSNPIAVSRKVHQKKVERSTLPEKSQKIKKVKKVTPSDSMETESTSEDSCIINEQKDQKPSKSHQQKQPILDIQQDQELYENMKEQYNDLIKELWNSQTTLESLELSQNIIDALNKRSELWIKYFVFLALFRDKNVNLFSFTDSFTKTEKFL